MFWLMAVNFRTFFILLFLFILVEGSYGSKLTYVSLKFVNSETAVTL